MSKNISHCVLFPYPTFSGIILACDGQMDGQTDRHMITAYTAIV